MSTHKVKREPLLRSLEAVSAGLAVKASVEQGNCLVFDGDHVRTFDGEVACTHTSPLPITGAVVADKLLKLLDRLNEDLLTITVGEGKVVIKGNGRQGTIRMEEEVKLPVDQIDIPDDGDWGLLPEEFLEGLGLVATTAAVNDTEHFVLNCINFNPNYLQSCNNSQLSRYPMTLPITGDSLIQANAARHIIQLGMTEVSVSQNWIHFRNPAGLLLSCRRHTDQFPEIDNLLEVKGSEVTLPGGLAEAVATAQIFSDDNPDGDRLVQVDLKPNGMRLIGTGPHGEFEERRKVAYAGEPISFLIDPKMLVEITDRANTCTISPGRLFVSGGRFLYMACLREN